jgi:murein DD-endopeptidase MepM/ murein hydrolase activator NlpD
VSTATLAIHSATGTGFRRLTIAPTLVGMAVPSLVRSSFLLTAVVLALAPAASTAPAAPPLRVPPVSPAAGPVRYRWPLDGQPVVVRPFDPPPQPWLPGHRGVDLAAAPGSVVRAAGAGVVVFAGQVVGRGVVSVEHPGGLRTTYEPVSPLVRAGQEVRAGDPIGVLVAGHVGCPTPACLHWGLRRGEAYLDPLSLLGAGRVRLLPLEGGVSGSHDSG